MKQIFKQIGLSATMLLVFLPAFAYDFEANGLFFDIISVPDGTCELVKGKVFYKGDVVIPEYVEYRNRPFSVIGIGKATFGDEMGHVDNAELISVKISNSIKYIGKMAFQGCVSLKTVSIPNSVTEIGEAAFYKCTSLQAVTIPNSITTISERAFLECSSLQTITIPSTVKEIRNRTFAGCTSLQTITIPSSVTEIQYSAFAGCTSLQTITIPSSVTEIQFNAFSGCSSLQTITLPSSMTEIDDEVFSGCTSLQTITIPSSVTEVGLRSFSGCINLKKVTLNCGSSKLYFHTNHSPGTIDQPRKFYNFDGCENLTTIALGRDMGYIYDNGFGKSYVYDFESEYKYSGLFSNVTTLKVLKDYFPSQILMFFRNILHLLFKDGVDLSKVEYLSYLTKLQTLTLESATPPVCPKFSNNQYLNMILYVPAGTLEAYQNADGWKYFFDIREVEVSGVKEVQSGARRVIGRYDINGSRVDEDFKGITIVKFSDGSTKKYINR